MTNYSPSAAEDLAADAASNRSELAWRGNRLVLLGAGMYLLEWIAIIAAHLGVPVGAEASDARLLDAYAGRADAFGWAAGWFSVVLLGRIAIVVGLRSVLTQRRRLRPLLDCAVLAMSVSVTIEIVVYAVSAGAAWARAHGGSTSSLRALDAAAYEINAMVFGPLGVSLLCVGIAMLLSGAFGRVLCGLGITAGALATVQGLVAAGPGQSTISGMLMTGVVLFWIWSIWVGVVVWRGPRIGRVGSRTGA